MSKFRHQVGANEADNNDDFIPQLQLNWYISFQ